MVWPKELQYPQPRALSLAVTPHLGAGAGSERSGAPTGILHLDTT